LPSISILFTITFQFGGCSRFRSFIMSNNWLHLLHVLFQVICIILLWFLLIFFHRWDLINGFYILVWFRIFLDLERFIVKFQLYYWSFYNWRNQVLLYCKINLGFHCLFFLFFDRFSKIIYFFNEILKRSFILKDIITKKSS
jgi:hypothetical protein